MGKRTDREELLVAWRALAGKVTQADGWRTIALDSPTGRRVRAGRHFPDNTEAILVGFSLSQPPRWSDLPSGQGFRIGEARLESEGIGWHWVALSRRVDGSLDVFALLVADIIGTLETRENVSDERLFDSFLSRIRAWQDFMSRKSDAKLTHEEEAGLFGELIFVGELVRNGLAPRAVIDSWVGPLDGVQDFALGSGAIEVKATVATSGFPVSINSLDQLDDSQRQPLYLGAVRLRQNRTGLSLPSLVEQTRELVSQDRSDRQSLDMKLIQAGYLDALAPEYDRCFDAVEIRIFEVGASFPRLIRASVPAQVTSAKYGIELDHVEIPSMEIVAALNQLGVI